MWWQSASDQSLPDVAGIYKGSLAIGNQTDFTAEQYHAGSSAVIILFILLFSGIIFIFLSIVKSGQWA